MRNYKFELENRVSFIKRIIKDSGAQGIVYGNSGGKDSALVGILCRSACENVLGVLMPCSSRRNYDEDIKDGIELATQFDIKSLTVDLTETRAAIINAMGNGLNKDSAALVNIAPRLRMATLYALAQDRNSLVAGTGNKSEAYVGYFTKWGDGAYDFNPIYDLTVTEIYEFLRYLKAPKNIIDKAPSGALFDGQTDEAELGFSYAELDSYLSGGSLTPDVQKRIDSMHDKSEHKRRSPITYSE